MKALPSTETSFTPKASVSFQMDPEQPVLCHLRQGIPARRRQRAAAGILRRRRRSQSDGLRKRRTADVQLGHHAKLRGRLEEQRRASASESPPACTTSSGRTSSRTSTCPTTADCSSPTTWARPSPRDSTSRPRWCWAQASPPRWRSATPARATPSRLRRRSPCWSRRAMRFPAKPPSTTARGPIRRGHRRDRRPVQLQGWQRTTLSCAWTGSTRPQ